MTANSNLPGTPGEGVRTDSPDSFLDDLRNLGAQLHNGRVSDFGDARAEAEALASVGVVPLLGTTPLRLTGADRLDFLHGQVSHEVKRLTPGEGRAALMLNVRGHALALLRIFRRDDDLFVAVEGGAGARVEAQLRAHIVFDQVEIHNLSDTLSTLSVQGGGAGAVLQEVFRAELSAPETFSQPPFASAKVLVASAARSRAGGYDLHVLTRDAPALLHELREAGAALAGERALEALRIEAGLAGAEFEGGEGVLPQEAGLEHAVSYRKGCYLGQEIMARIEARGKVRRRLAGLMLAAPPAPEARDLTQEGKVVGRLGGVATHPRLGVIALASVRSELEEGAVLEVAGAPATLTRLPFEV
jgi:tRNA-modifying protein YgfZ